MKTGISKEKLAIETDSVLSHSGRIGSNSDIRKDIDALPNSVSDITDMVKKLHRARPYIFKKKTPPPGAYPKPFSPFQLASHFALNNAVALTPAEVYSDCKLLKTCIKREFSSQYFDEEGYAEESVKPPKPQVQYCCPRRTSSSRYSSRRVKLH